MAQSQRIDRSFFQKPTLEVAKNLLGCLLVVKNKHIKVGQISETEAYIGQDDLACHASHGRTSRNAVLFDSPAGLLYIYLIYGIYHMLNITTETQGFPAGVLIRSVTPIKNISTPTNGPGLLTKALNINMNHLNLDITSSSSPIYILPPPPNFIKKFTTSPRIGIDYAGPVWSQKPWRFTLNQTSPLPFS